MANAASLDLVGSVAEFVQNSSFEYIGAIRPFLPPQMPESSERTSHRRPPGPRDPLLGTWLDGRYLIEERIATGGFGAVYRARSAGGMALALKVLHPALTGDPNMVARFRREGAALTQLHDPHTVSTLAVGETAAGTLYIAMELLTGESLRARLERERALPWQAAVGIARAVCSSLAEAHALGVIHRDLKPDNIHVETRGGEQRVVVIDFGIVGLAPGSAIDDGRELTSVGHMIGTYDYMSPEQVAGDRCEAASDIYSLGVVLYEMLTGRRPFAKLAGAAAMMTQLLIETPVQPSVFVAIPPALDRAVMRCLARDPAHRFASVDELAAALARILAHRPSAREEITEVHPVCTGDDGAPTLRDDALLHTHPGEDAAICRDDDDATARLDLDRTWSSSSSPTLPGIAVATARGSGAGLVAPRRRSAETMLAPAIPPVPPVHPAITATRAVPPRPSHLALMIFAALAAGLTTFLLATLLGP
jgi:serine/threonine-protein kinase